MDDQAKKPAGEADLVKALDENLEAMGALLKAKKGDEQLSFNDLLKDEKMRSKMREKLAEYDKDESDVEDEAAAEGETAEEEADEKEAKEEKEDMKGKKSKMKKSDAESLDEIIDAVPVLKSFVSSLEALSAKLDKVEAAQAEQSALQKSMADVLSVSGNLIKSLNSDIEGALSRPAPRKGVISQDDLIQKSFGGDKPAEDDMLKSLPIEQIRDELLKAVTDRQISPNSVSKWELSGYSLAAIPTKDFLVLKNRIKGGVK